MQPTAVPAAELGRSALFRGSHMMLMMKPILLLALIGVLTNAVMLACGIWLYQRASMQPSFEYRVCLVQDARVTFVNGSWQGAMPMDLKNQKESLDSCPLEWEYLVKAGVDGWEL